LDSKQAVIGMLTKVGKAITPKGESERFQFIETFHLEKTRLKGGFFLPVIFYRRK